MDIATDPIELHQQLRQAILNALTRRDYAILELSHKLERKGFPPSAIASILPDFIQNGLINEHRFTENFIHWRRARGYGPLRIAKELQARGIEALMIADLLKITDNSWFTDAHRIWQKQFKQQLPKNFQERAKQMRFLQYRGFTGEQIRRVFQDTDSFT